MIRTSAILVSLLLGLIVNATCQLGPEPISAPQPSPDPVQVFNKLMPSMAVRGSTSEEVLKNRTVEALRALGIQYGTEINSARLRFEDVDGDNSPEAFLLIDFDIVDVTLIAFKKKGNQWYRLPQEPEFSCWCKYESSPLDGLLEIRDWDIYPKKEPNRLLLVRGSSGGTGLYERSLVIYALRGTKFLDVFGTIEERRDCSWPDGKCEFQHDDVKMVRDGDLRAIVSFQYVLHGRSIALPDELWWTQLPVNKCTAYVWNASKNKFVESEKAMKAYCELPKTRAVAPPQAR